MYQGTKPLRKRIRHFAEDMFERAVDSPFVLACLILIMYGAAICAGALAFGWRP